MCRVILKWHPSTTDECICCSAGAQALYLSVLLAVVCLCDPCDTTYFFELWRIRSVLMLYCSSVPLLLSLFEPNKYLLLLLLLMQTTFNGLRCICWIHLCCLIAQNIFVHSCIHCSCYTLLDVVTQTDVVGQVYVALTPLPDSIYDLDQPRTT